MRYRDLLEASSSIRIYAHVSPGANLDSILRQGLLPNAGGGNYSGYWEALDGVYVTNDPTILRQHIFARGIEPHYVIVLVQVAGRNHLDEDVIDNLVLKCFNEVLRRHGLSDRDSDRMYDMGIEDQIKQELVASVQAALGPPKRNVLSKEPNLIEEYVDSWLSERYEGGEGPGGEWWTYAKGLILRAFSTFTDDRNLRIPKTIGYTGKTRIIAVVNVVNGEAHVVRGTVPSDAQDLVTTAA